MGLGDNRFTPLTHHILTLAVRFLTHRELLFIMGSSGNLLCNNAAMVFTDHVKGAQGRRGCLEF